MVSVSQDPITVSISQDPITVSVPLSHISVSLSPGPIKRTIWSLISLASCAFLLYFTYKQIDLYFDFNVNVLVNMEHRRQMDFPAITVCNHNAVKRSQVGNAPEIRELLFGSTADSETAAPPPGDNTAPPQGDNTAAPPPPEETAAPPPVRRKRQARKSLVQL